MSLQSQATPAEAVVALLAKESVPVPQPGRGEVLIQAHACGVCYHDVINRPGSLPRTHVPAILGPEAAGEVVKVGPDTAG